MHGADWLPTIVEGAAGHQDHRLGEQKTGWLRNLRILVLGAEQKLKSYPLVTNAYHPPPKRALLKMDFSFSPDGICQFPGVYIVFGIPHFFLGGGVRFLTPKPLFLLSLGESYFWGLGR